MLVDDVGDVTVTNDGATILKNLEVEHPAAKVLCELADLQVCLVLSPLFLSKIGVFVDSITFRVAINRHVKSNPFSSLPQDQEVGDGTTSVVIIAAELLKNAEELVKQKIHPTSIISGYRLACKEACKYLNDNLTINVDDLGRECIVNAG